MRCGQRGDLTSGAAMATPIFYTDVAIDQEVSNTIQQGWLASDACSACFERRPLLFVNAHSAEPSYPKGANIMFYRLVLALGRYPGFDYFMIMELDVVPVQPLWLESLVSLLPPRVPHFWIKGTAPRSESPSGFKRLHMNGNALYTARDPSFVIFVDHAVSRYGRSIEEGDMAFDVLIQDSLDSMADAARNKIIHNLIFSNFIRNGGQLDPSEEPCTIFAHQLNGSRCGSTHGHQRCG